MRKLYAKLLSVIMLTSFAISAFAAASPEAVVKDPENAVSVTEVDVVSEKAVSEVDVASEKTVSVTVTDVVIKAAATTVVEAVKSLVGNSEHMANLKVPANAKLAAVVDISYSGEIPEGGVKIPFTVNNAKAGDYVILLHRKSVEPFQWEVVGRGVLGSDLTIVGTFTNFSPVAIMVIDAADMQSAGIKAPKTGEF